MALTLTGENENLRAQLEALQQQPDSQPVPGIAHGSIPGLLGVEMGKRPPGMFARSELSSAPTRTDAPSDPASQLGDWLRGQFAANAAPQQRDFGAGGGMPIPPMPQPATTGQAPAAASTADVPPLPPPVNVGMAPGMRGSPMPPPLPPSPAAMAPNQPATATAAAIAPQQDNSPIPRDSLLGRLLGGLSNWRDQNRLTLLAMAGGLAGAPSLGTGLSRAFTAAVPAQRADIAQNQQNQTAQALMARGLPRDIALAASTNPALLQQLLPQLFGAKQLQHLTIKDSLGNDIPLTFDPAKGKYYDMSGKEIGAGGAGSTAGGIPGLSSAAANLPVEIDPSTGRDEKFLAALGPIDRAAVTSILDGDASAQGRNMQKYLPYAARAEPGFSQQTYQTRLTTMRDFAPQGVSGKNLTAISTGLGHLDRLNGAIDKLGNFTTLPGVVNPVYNTIRGQFSPEYQRNVAGFRQDVNAVAGEMAKAFRATGMSEADIDHWRKSFGEDSSPETMKAAAQEALHLLDSRLEAIGAAYNRGMGLSSTKPAPELLSPVGRQIHEKMMHGETGTATPAPTFRPASDWQFSPSRGVYRDPSGKLHDINGNPL